MAQGKLKVKTKTPVTNKKPTKKGKAFVPRKNVPIQSKKHKFQEAHKLKQMISRTVNKKNEDDIHKLAFAGQQNLSQAQQAVLEHHQKQEVAQASTSK